MDFKQQCSGYASYRWYSNGSIEVAGVGYPSYDRDSAMGRQIVKFWDQYQPIMTRYAEKFDLPLAWVVAIIAIESGGNEWACAPCQKYDSEGNVWCSVAPGCGGGVASDGKTYSCCAYGLMQVIDYNARKYGMDHGAQLLGNPDDSIRIGCTIFANALRGGAQGDPLVAARMYNGCKSCGGGKAPCGGGGMFGIGGQGNYAEKFVKAANTFHALGLRPVTKSGIRFSTVAGLGMLAVAGVLAVGVWDRQRG
jgi:hypothetical protein